jgi:lipopolysaccharide/colanic/teichoic acid biosynthesis glycosyltransferase
MKRLTDIFISAVLLAVCSPLIALTALAVALTSRGPLLYRQQRVGARGRTFEIIKFRTMCVGADKSGPSVTSADDARITPIGRFLRKSKLDELPQLLNVLKGEMSLVGPRPQVPRFVQEFDPAKRTVVLSVPPGVTGITSICYRNEETMLAKIGNRESYYLRYLLPRKLEIDVWYVSHRSLFSDLYLIAATGWLLIVPQVSALFGRSRGVDEEIVEAILAKYIRLTHGADFPMAAHTMPILEDDVPSKLEERREVLAGARIAV